MAKLSEYELVADGIEAVLKIPRPVIDNMGGANARVVIPPVTMLEELMLDGSDGFWAPDEIAPDLLPNFNVAFVVPRPDIMPGLMVFNWVRTASVAQRRRARFHSKYMVAVTHAGIVDGKWLEMETRLCSFINGHWRDALGAQTFRTSGGDIIGRVIGSTTEDDQRIRLAMSIGLNMRYCYSAVLSDHPDRLSARIFAYPDTVRFILRTRNLPNEGRRKALVHLVKRHSRRRKKAFRVLAHLRGEHRCQWAGLDVIVLPSQYDAENTMDGAVKGRLAAEGLRRWVAA